MSFDIRFKAANESKVFDGEAGRGVEGRIAIGDFWESFFAVTNSWSAADYEASWGDNLATLRSGRDAFFLTDVGEAGSELLFRCWPAFHHVGEVLFTEKLLLRSDAGGKVDFENVPELIGFDDLKRAVGTGVSFWKLPLAEI